MTTQEYLTIVLSGETGRFMFIDKNGAVSDSAKDGSELRMDYQKPHQQVLLFL